MQRALSGGNENAVREQMRKQAMNVFKACLDEQFRDDVFHRADGDVHLAGDLFALQIAAHQPQRFELAAREERMPGIEPAAAFLIGEEPVAVFHGTHGSDHPGETGVIGE